MCAEVVIKDVNVARLISEERHVATASRFLHVLSLTKESRASPVTEILEVVRVSKNIRQDREDTDVGRREVAPWFYSGLVTSLSPVMRCGRWTRCV